MSGLYTIATASAAAGLAPGIVRLLMDAGAVDSITIGAVPFITRAGLEQLFALVAEADRVAGRKARGGS